MANSYTQLYVQYVLQLKGRTNLIKKHFVMKPKKSSQVLQPILNSKTYAIIVILIMFTF